LSPPVQAESIRSSIKKKAKSHLDQYSALVKKVESGGNTCDLGILSLRNEYVTRVSDKVTSDGLRPGDKLLKFDETEITQENYADVYSKYDPNDEVVVHIRRGNSIIDVPMVCGDQTPKDQALSRMLRAASKGKWQECIDQSREADRIIGTPIAFTTRYRLNCNEAKRCGFGGCKSATRHDVEYWYEYRVESIEEAVYANDALDDIRSDVLTIIGLLENNGYRRLANDLESRLRAAESNPPPTVSQSTTPSQPTKGYGTCFAVSDSEVLTSHHVVEGASIVTVVFQDGVEKGAIVLEQSQSTDLALLKINGTTPAFLPLAPMRSLKVGEEVFTLGFPVTSILGTDAKFTEGSVSSLSGIQNDASFFQMSVPVQPGNSGGPVVNVRGEVVGIVTATAAIEAFYAATGSLPQNINWASKSDYAQLLFDALDLEKRAKDRAEAIEMTYSALCKVTAE